MSNVKSVIVHITRNATSLVWPTKMLRILVSFGTALLVQIAEKGSNLLHKSNPLSPQPVMVPQVPKIPKSTKTLKLVPSNRGSFSRRTSVKLYLLHRYITTGSNENKSSSSIISYIHHHLLMNICIADYCTKFFKRYLAVFIFICEQNCFVDYLL